MDEGNRDHEIVAALNAIVAVELRWGFWKCFDRLRQLGRPWNHKRVHRVYCQMRLNQQRRAKKRLPKRERQSMLVVPMVNAVWALDFMFDSLYSGRAVRTLNVLDEANRGALGIDNPLRQRPRAHELRVYAVVQRQQHYAAFHPARKTQSERLH